MHHARNNYGDYSNPSVVGFPEYALHPKDSSRIDAELRQCGAGVNFIFTQIIILYDIDALMR
ncbi:hypothetical protein BOTBODRAFT_33914 [Botryobasidium botryosum FD-172 SS1]|uniref:Methylenetetrahydrofolate reductase (NAD(P)H) n=1 Tax=Botryobasidium botryosum (strain FD-172 SS1) TaxID=930990 RepID=A0A067MBU0_BOTB1|nr:hypothetical protein BOTBODRAFT_33914 [Botryobasidium botryosum FD-172 SS1]